MTLVLKCLICHEEIEYSQHNPIELIKHMKTFHPRLTSKNNKLNNQEEIFEKFDKAVEVSLGENAKVLYKSVTKSIQTEITMNNLTKISTCNCDDKNSNSKSKTSEEEEVTEIFVNRLEDYPSTHNKPKKSDNQRLKKKIDNHINTEKEKLLKEKSHKKFYRTSIEHWRPVGDAKIHCPRCRSHKRPIIRTQRQHVTNSSLISSFLMACWPLCSSPCLLPEPKFENLYCSVCSYHLGVFNHQKKTVVSNPRLRE